MTLEPVRAAIRAAITENPARLKGEAIAKRMLVSTSTLYGYGETDAEGEARKTIPLERLLQFTLVTEDGRALSELCALAGYVALRLPSRASSGAEPAALKALHDFSSFMETHSKALLDDLIEDDELTDIEKRADAAMLAIARVAALARKKREAGKNA